MMTEFLNKAIQIKNDFDELQESFPELATLFISNGIQVIMSPVAFSNLAKLVNCKVEKKFRDCEEYPIELSFIYKNTKFYLIH